MNDLKKYLEVAGEAARLVSLNVGLKETVGAVSAELEPLENEALKAEISGEETAADLKSAFNSKKANLQKAKIELDESIKRLRACQELLPGLRAKAAGELEDAYRKPFERDLKAFAAAVKAAYAAERDLVSLRERIQDEFNKIDAPCPIAAWPPVLMRKPGRTNAERGWERFINQMKVNGYDVDTK